jgi:hypothetical protein
MTKIAEMMVARIGIISGSFALAISNGSWSVNLRPSAKEKQYWFLKSKKIADWFLFTSTDITCSNS